MNRNTCFDQLPNRYLFTEVMARTETYRKEHPGCRIFNMGIGDITRPLPASIIEAMHRAVEELGHEETFKGYCLEEGYPWLRQAIIDHDFHPRGIDLQLNEVFISDGAGSDLGNLDSTPGTA